MQIARNSDKNSKKTRKHAVKLSPNPSPRWKWILDPSGITEGRWIDPTGSTPRSNGQDVKPVVQDWTKPVQSAYKRSWGPVHFIFPFVSLSSLRFLSFSLLLTLTLTAPFMAFTHQTWFLAHKLWINTQFNTEWTWITSILRSFWRKWFEPFDFDIFWRKRVRNVSIYKFFEEECSKRFDLQVF